MMMIVFAPEIEGSLSYQPEALSFLRGQEPT